MGVEELNNWTKQLIAFRQLSDDAHEALKQKNDELSLTLLEEIIRHLEKQAKQDQPWPYVHERWPFEALAKVLRRKKDFKSEIVVLERFFGYLGRPPSTAKDFELYDRLQDAKEELKCYVAERGTCEACKKRNRALRRKPDGQVVCLMCIRSSNFIRKEDRVSSHHRNIIQQAGLEVPENVTKDDAKRLMDIASNRQHGLRDDAPREELLAAIRRRQFFAKVVGVTFTNSDGTSRQSIIRKCTIGERLQLVREQDNPSDSNAVRVSRLNGETIGYLASHVVSSDMGLQGVASMLDEGMVAEVVIERIYPIERLGGDVFGVVIDLILTLPYYPKNDSSS